MKDLIEIVSILKKIKGLKTDKQIAELLNINPRTIETDKFRGKIPYKEIISFCSSEGISPAKIFYGDERAETSCQRCSVLSPQDQEKLKQAIDILSSEDKITKDALYTNLTAFHRDIKRYEEENIKTLKPQEDDVEYHQKDDLSLKSERR